MKPPAFGLVVADSADAAAQELAHLGDDAKLLAGGQSLMPLLALRLARPSILIDIDRASDMSSVEVGPESVRLGALVRHQELLAHPDLIDHLPLLTSAARHIGHRAIRNRGTLGGSLAHADPAAELPAVLLALDGAVLARSVRGVRRIPGQSLFQGFLTTSLAGDEILEAVELPLPPPRMGWSFEEFSRRHGDFAICAVAVGLALDADHQTVTDARVAFAGVDSVPVRSTVAEEVLRGMNAATADWAEVSAVAVEALVPPGDLHGTSAYRRHLAGVLLRRALAGAAHRAAGGPRERRYEPVGHGRPAARRAEGAGRARAARRTEPGAELEVELRVNRAPRVGRTEARTSLGDFLRSLGLTGTHLGCEQGACGACTVLMDEASVRSCLVLAAQAEGREVVTVEGLESDTAPHALQTACRSAHSFQCGFCAPGFLMAAAELLGQSPCPDEREVRTALSGNLCRCTGYQSIVEGVLDASRIEPGADPSR